MTDIIEKITDLNNLINDNQKYIANILYMPENYENHKFNFVNLLEIKKNYENIYTLFENNPEQFYHLFKCFYEIYIKYITNIYNYVLYLDNYRLFKKGVITNLEKQTEKENYFKLLLNYLELDETRDEIYLYVDLYKLADEIKNYRKIVKIPELVVFTRKKNNININSVFNKRILETLIDNLQNYILNSIIDIVELHKYLKNKQEYIEYITLPQYKPICWYISILTCMCYSDLNKKLIFNKIRKGIEKSKKNNNFHNLVKFIITNITNDFKKYDTSNSCKYLEDLKTKPLTTLNKLIKTNIDNFIREFKFEDKIIYDEKENKYDMSKTNFQDFYQKLYMKYFCSNISYFITFIYNNIEEHNDDILILNLNNISVYEIFNSDISIISYFYSLINIYCKYFYLLKDDNDNEFNIYEYKYETDNKEIPDILVLEYNNDYFSNNKENIKKVVYSLEIDDETMNYLTYNKTYRYKLDYVIHSNDENIISDRKNYKHIISAITYNGVEYIYDSDRLLRDIKCKDNSYKIPCSLIKHNWKHNVNKEISYCTTLCEYNMNCDLKNVYKNDICFTFNYNIIYVYVRIS